MPSRLPGCLELHINGGSPLREVRHAINFLKDLKAVVQHDWSLGLLVEGEGKRRLEDILATQTLTWTSLEQKTLAASCPFPTVIIPLLQMCLSFDERFPHLPRQTNTLYAIVCIPDLFGKIVSLFDRPEAAGSSLPFFSMDHFCILCAVLEKAILRFPGARVNQVYNDLAQAVSKLLPSFQSHLKFADAQQIMQRNSRLLGFRQEELGRPLTTEAESLGHFQRARRVAAPNDYDPPGALSQGGQRHNNDNENVSKISVVPTPSELVCARFPALPRNSADAPHHLPAGSIDRLVDVHFRQLRHEAIFPLNQASRTIVAKCSQVVSLVRGRGSSKIDMERQLGCSREDSVTLFAFGNAKYTGVDVNQRMGVVACFEVDEIAELQGKTLGCRRNAWKKGEVKLLTATDMALILRTDGKHPHVPISCAVVASSPQPLTQGDGARSHARLRVELRLVDRSAAALSLFADVNGKYMLFDVRAGFFSFEPILESLKEINTLPDKVSPVLFQLALTKDKLEPKMPNYIIQEDFLDFSCLLKPGSDADDRLWAQRVETRALWEKTAELSQRLSAVSRLDPGQVGALLGTLQSSIAITQGPPGTGKTFLGVALVELLLANRLVGREQGPLLVVCYTNHALDQFLENILKKKSDVKMVRMGGGTKSKTLAPFVLGEQWHMLGRGKSRYDAGFGQRLGFLKESLEQEQEESERLKKEMQESNPSWSELSGIIEMELPEMFEAFSAAKEQLEGLDFEIGGLSSDILQHWLRPLRRIMASAPSRAKAVSDLTFSNSYSIFEEMEIEELEEDIEELEADEGAERGDEGRSESCDTETPVQAQAQAVSDLNYSPEIERILFQPSSPAPCDVQTLSLEKARALDPWTLPINARVRIYHILRDTYRANRQYKYIAVIEKLERIFADLDEIRSAAKANFLKVQDIIGATMTGLGKFRKMIQASGAKVLVLEEAAEILEVSVRVCCACGRVHQPLTNIAP